MRRAHNVEIREEPRDHLSQYAEIPIAFEVRSLLDVIDADGMVGRFVLRQRPVQRPFTKDYDAIAGNHPIDWMDNFDRSNWTLLSARVGDCRIGGAVVDCGNESLSVLNGPDAFAVLRDLRVSPEMRGLGVGSALFAAAERLAGARGFRRIVAETQNINVAACRFYASRGCELRSVDRFAYPDLSDEIRLIWCKDVERSRSLPE